MQYDVKTPREYLDAIEPDWRKATLLELRELIRRHAPEFDESIKHGMLSYDHEKGGGLALNAQKNSVNLYVGNATKVDPDGKLLAGLDVGKGCIRVKKSNHVASTGLEAFIRKTAELLRSGADLSC